MNIFHNLYFFSNLRAVCEIFLHSLVFKTSSQWFTSRLLLCGDALFFLPGMCDEPIFSADGHELAQFFFSISKIVYSTFTFSLQIGITHIIKIRGWLVWLKILLDRKIKNPWKYSIKWKTNFIRQTSNFWRVISSWKKNRDREFFFDLFSLLFKYVFNNQTHHQNTYK